MKTVHFTKKPNQVRIIQSSDTNSKIADTVAYIVDETLVHMDLS